MYEAGGGGGGGVNEVKLLLAFAKHLHPVTIQNGYRAPRPNIQQTDTAYVPLVTRKIGNM